MTKKNTNELDCAQQEAVDISINAVVSAGAGSGKTKVLSKRFTDLLLRDKSCKVEQILTLTFTRKATVEMTSRIYKELSQVCPGKAKDFYKANIKTLDSYCSQVAKQGCRFYGISPDFSVDDELVKNKIHDLALPFILKHRDDTVIKELVSTKDFSTIAKQLFVNTILKGATIAEKIDFDSAIKKQYEQVSTEWILTCKKLQNLFNNLINCLESFKDDKKKFVLALKEAVKNQIPEIPVIDFSKPIDENRTTYINFFRMFDSIKQNGAREDCNELKEIHNNIKSLLIKLESLENYIYGTKFVNGLIPLLEEFQNQVNEMKRSSSFLSYSDVSSLAMKILIEHPEIRNIEKNKYRYIMIDEFQDNNLMQRNLLFLLAEKKNRTEKSIPTAAELEKDKLFFVGDEKQSIYKFRGADVSVFRGLAKDFNDGNRELKTNYRSHPALIAAFNTIFGGLDFLNQTDCKENNLENSTTESKDSIPCVFYTEHDSQIKKQDGQEIPGYEAIYHNVKIPDFKLNCKTKKEKLDLFNQHVHFAIFNSEQNLDSNFYDKDKTECYWVVNKIKELINGENHYKPSDIAILFRSYSLLPTYEKILLNEGIPYFSETVKGFFSDGPVNDIMSFLRLQAYPSDKFSFANILRSPFVNLSDTELKNVLATIENQSCVFDVCVDNVLSEESAARFYNCKAINDKLTQMVKTETLVKIISYLWYETGYRYETLWNKTVYMYASSYDRLFELARKADLTGTGLSEFVDSIDGYQSESEKLDDMEIPLESSEGVHIMSIHKSKGLEFPVVFVCGAGHSGKHDLNDSFSYFSPEYGITINTPASPVAKAKSNYFYELQKNFSYSMDCAELKRLTYVALTRAEQEVYITGSYKYSKISEWISIKDEKSPAAILEVLLPTLNYFATWNNTTVSDESENLSLSIDSEIQKNCPFTFEEIFPKEKQFADLTLANKGTIISLLKDEYQTANVITKSESELNYVNPSKLHPEDDETFTFTKNDIQVDKSIPFSEIDKLVKGSATNAQGVPEFSYANFGTIAHACMESAIMNIPFVPQNSELNGLHGEQSKIEVVNKICNLMRDEFLKSDIGKEIQEVISANEFFRCEYSFKSVVNKKIINGQIDLVFKNKNNSGFTIVDYKTNKEIKPELYFVQLACYRDAIAKMLGTNPENIRCVLYYLRFGKSVDVSKDCDMVKLSELI